VSGALFDPDAIVRAVRAAANLAAPCDNRDIATFAAVGERVIPCDSRDIATVGPVCRNVAIVTTPRAPINADYEAAIEERAGLATDRVPACYLDAWARLNHQQNHQQISAKPFAVSDAEWRLALNDGGLFLDAWGHDAAALGWTPGDLFDVTAGLVWRLAGERVEALGPGHARLGDRRAFIRQTSANVR